MLASVIIKKMKQCSENPVYIEFGTVKKNGDLVTDTFQKPIGRKDYSILEHCICCGTDCQCDNKTCQCSHGIKEGMDTRVLVVWAGEEPVVIGVLV